MIRAFGLDWKDGTSPVTIHLSLYKNQRMVEALNGEVMGQAYHLANAIRFLYPREILTWHPWLDDHINIWCDGDFFTVWGPAASGKSNDFGLICLVDWFSAPEDTCTFVCSTSKAMLEKRIWESITRYFNYAKRNHNVPGKFSRQRTAIINERDRDEGDEVKAGLTGVAVKQGTVEDAQSNLIGAHLPYVRLLLDEMQATRRAAVEARKNLSKGCINFKFGGLGNPMSLLDLLGEFSEPIGGWDTVNVDSTRWQTRYGWCYHFDGFKSPAITEPDGETKYPFLINRTQIDRDVQECGGLEDHPDIWTMCRGFVPPEGVVNTILSRNMIRHGHAMEPATWQFETTYIAGLDPAFTAGGDKCILSVCKVGKMTNGKVGIEAQPHIEIGISASDPRTVSEQIVDQTIGYCKEYGVKPEHLGIDESGTQSLADFFAMKGWSKCHRVSFQSTASNLPVSRYNPTPCSEEYNSRLAELWYSVRQFVVFDQVRNLDPQAAIEFCERLAIATGAKKGVEKKEDMKERLNHSPDDADAFAIALDVVRQKLGVFPGDSEADPSIFGFPKPQSDKDWRNAETPENAYEEEPDFSGYEESML